MCRDALAREESCGCHFRVEHQTPDGEALRDDDPLRPRGGVGARRTRPECRSGSMEPLHFETLAPCERSYR